MKFTFFNLTNVADLMAGKKARLELVGPYTYQMRKFKYFFFLTHIFSL
jgi:hypothetical protein